MKRPLHIWVGFSVSFALVLAAMGWISLTVLELDAAERRAEREAAVEESVRLALWRVDSALSPIIGRENARPYFTYAAFYPAARAYTRMFAEIQHGDILVPSPLLTELSPEVKLHFQIEPDGKLTSPKVPTGNMLDLAESGYVPPEEIDRARERLEVLQRLVDAETLLAQLPPLVPGEDGATTIAAGTRGPEPPPEEPPALVNANTDPPQQQIQTQRSQLEWQVRAQTYQALSNDSMQQAKRSSLPANVEEGDKREVEVGLLHPVWIDDHLLLVRRIRVADVAYLQGVWLDWPQIRTRLTARIGDLLPGAQLEPLRAAAPGEPSVRARPPSEPTGDSRLLAALPVRLTAGIVPLSDEGGLTPIQLSLIVAWGCVLLAGLAVFVLLRGAVSLSERRGAFVSAVTHELRTPLTTFRMYTEMLADGMVPDPERQREYLGTLQGEAERLAHLVENVLSYARLERNRHGIKLEHKQVGALVESIEYRLRRRAEEADLELSVELDADAREAWLRTDLEGVERVLFNLVDNAAKYAGGVQDLADRRLHLTGRRRGRKVILAVRDHGPGIDDELRQRLFRPFSKSAEHAATSAPGVGLGLALCRGLARTLGGDLTLDTGWTEGAAFELKLPLSDAPPV